MWNGDVTVGVAEEPPVSPHDLHAEKAVLGAILIIGAIPTVVAALIRDSDFFRVAHRQIFRQMAVLTAYGTPIDLVTLCDALDRSGELDDVDGPAYISSLADGVPHS